METLSERFGDDLGEINGMRFFAFPTVSQMCNVTEEDLRDCKTGFRAPYIVDAVQKTADGQISEAALKAADTAECEKMLTKIKGVGSKVANCCMLFGLDKRDAFPVDVWIKRIMAVSYTHLEGLITIGDIAKSYFQVYDSTILATAQTRYQNIVDTLEGTVVAGEADGIFKEGKVVIAAANPDMMENYIGTGDIVILGNRYEMCIRDRDRHRICWRSWRRKR